MIRDYPKVNVTVFSSVRQIYKANIVDVDIANDLAVLKIESDRPLPVAKLANSDMVKATDTILTIGSPFGFEHTVSEVSLLVILSMKICSKLMLL